MGMRNSARGGGRWCGFALALGVAGGGCNALFGVDELAFDAGPSGPGSGGGDAATSTAAGNHGGDGGTAGGPGVGGGGHGGDATGGDATGGSGGFGLPLSYEVVGYESSPGPGDTVTVTPDVSASEGTPILAIVAGRGDGPVNVSDSADHRWLNVLEQVNDSNTAVVAMFTTTLTAPFSQQSSITASTGLSSDYRRALLVLAIHGDFSSAVSTSQAINGNSISLPSPVTAQREDALVFGVVATGYNVPTTYEGERGHAAIATYATTLSSGAFFIITPAVDAAPALKVSVSHNNASHAAGLVVLQ